MRVSALFSAVLWVAIAAPALAAIPKKHLLNHYRELWEDSMICEDPPPVTPAPPGPNPLEDYTLASLCKIADGWHVILLNKKNREERIRLRPNEPNDLGFRVISVAHPTSRQNAMVEIQAGHQSATVTFESTFLQVRGVTPISPPRGKVKGTVGKRPQQPPIPGFHQPKVRRIPAPPARK